MKRSRNDNMYIQSVISSNTSLVSQDVLSFICCFENTAISSHRDVVARYIMLLLVLLFSSPQKPSPAQWHASCSSSNFCCESFRCHEIVQLRCGVAREIYCFSLRTVVVKSVQRRYMTRNILDGEAFVRVSVARCLYKALNFGKMIQTSPRTSADLTTQSRCATSQKQGEENYKNIEHRQQ